MPIIPTYPDVPPQQLGGRARREFAQACYRLIKAGPEALPLLPTHFADSAAPHFYLEARRWAIAHPGADIIEIQNLIRPDRLALAADLLAKYERRLLKLYPMAWVIATELLKDFAIGPGINVRIASVYQTLFRKRAVGWIPDLKMTRHRTVFLQIVDEELANLDLTVTPHGDGLADLGGMSIPGLL